MVIISASREMKAITIDRPDFWLLALSNFITPRSYVWEVGETVALAVSRSSLEVVSPPLVFEL